MRQLALTFRSSKMKKFTLVILLALLTLQGCVTINEIEEELSDEASGPKYWLVLEKAEIDPLAYEENYLPSPWAVLFRGGISEGSTASCEPETFEPTWEDHVAFLAVSEWESRTWEIVVYDYITSTDKNVYIGRCLINITSEVLKEEMTVLFDDCDGFVNEIEVKFEKKIKDINLILERNPSC